MRRRKIVACPVCSDGKLYNTDEVICRQCQNDLERGRQIRARYKVGDSDTQVVTLGDGFLYEHRLPEKLKDLGPNSDHSERGLSALILEVTGQPAERAYGCEFDKTAWFPTGGSDFKVVVSKAQAESVRRLVDRIAALLYRARSEGFSRGQDLLMGLANGSVSVEKFNKESQRH